MKITDFPRILDVLTNAPDTSGGVALRRLLWSLYGGEMLWDALTSLDEALRLEFACLISQAFDARTLLSEELLKASGEWNRIDDHPLPA